MSLPLSLRRSVTARKTVMTSLPEAPTGDMLGANPLRVADADVDVALFAELRAREYSRLDRADEAYLDFTGAALYAESHIAAHMERLRGGLFGNPHSENGPSKLSTSVIEEARDRVLAFLDAPSDEYTVCFTANTTAAIKLVAESYSFGSKTALVLSADNHNSMNGLREFAGRQGSSVNYISLDEELRLDDPERILRRAMKGKRCLFGFPAQSNFSGVKHQLKLVQVARSLGCTVLLDAAAFLPASRLSLRRFPADFVAFSAYKILGYPTGVGALVARKESLANLRRPWFAGGTVEYASVQLGTHLARSGVEAFEDGTPAYLSIAALPDGFDYMESVGWTRMERHLTALTGYLLAQLAALSHVDGTPRVRLYGPVGTTARGATVAFNVLRRDGTAIPFAHVVDRARARGVSLRGGCFCNPGAAEAAFGFPPEVMAMCLRATLSDGFSIDGLSECLGPSIAVGAVRASLGIPSTRRDIDRMIEVLSSLE